MDKQLFENAENLFIRECRVKNLARDSIVSYKDKLKKLRMTLELNNVPTDINLITPDIIKNCILYMKEKEELQATTINTQLRAWRAFFNFLVDEEIIKQSPCCKIRLLRVRKTIIQTFTEEQLFLLFRQPKPHTFAGVRDITIMLLFLETGDRVRELTEISLGDINWGNMSIRIRGKGDKERLVYFQEKMKIQLEIYLRQRGRLHVNRLFVATWTDTPMTRRDVQYRLKKYGRSAGIENVRVSPHTLRHTFARMSVINKAGLFALQSMLGHSTLNQVLTYVNLFSDEIKNEHKKFSPLQNFGPDNSHDTNIAPFKQRDRA